MSTTIVPIPLAQATKERRVVCSPWIGEVEWEPGCELCFPAGLPGFELVRRMIPVEIPAHRPLVYLQGLELSEICFACLPVYVIDPGFSLSLSDEERQVLGIVGGGPVLIGEDVLCLGLLLPFGSTVEVNLNAPVVISLRTSLGLQLLGSPGETKRSFILGPGGSWIPRC